MKKIIIFLYFSFFIYGCQKPEGNLIKYTKANDINNVKNSIKESTNIDEMDSSGKTALMYAVISKNEEITELLIKEGAGINVKNDQWETPLSLATINNDINMIKLLLSKGADAKQNKEIAGLLEDDDPASKELLNVIFEKDKQLKFLLSLQNRVFYPNEISEIPDFVKEQKRLDSIWSFVKNIESKLSRNGISLDNFVEMCVADENENGSDYGITKEELTALGTVICLSEMCGGTTCLPKSAYKLNSNEFANRYSPGDAW